MEFSLASRWPRDKFNKIFKRKKIMKWKLSIQRDIRKIIGRNRDRVAQMFHLALAIS